MKLQCCSWLMRRPLCCAPRGAVSTALQSSLLPSIKSPHCWCFYQFEKPNVWSCLLLRKLLWDCLQLLHACRQNIGEDAVVDYPLERSEKLIQSVTTPHSSLSPPLRSVTPAPDDELVLSVTIHHCTALQPHSSLRHPLVKVHFVNTSTGEYLLKPDRYTCHMTSHDITWHHMTSHGIT